MKFALLSLIAFLCLFGGCAKASEPVTQTTSISESKAPPGHAPIQLSMEREQMIGVKFGPVVKKELFKTIHASGRVAFDPELYTAESEYQEALRQLERV